MNPLLDSVRDQIRLFQSVFETELAGHCDEGLRDRTRSQMRDLDLRLDSPPMVPVALLGTTGSGKSTLINALCGENVLKAADGNIGTAAVTTVENTGGDHFRAELSFSTLDEWNNEVERCRQILSQEPDEDDDSDSRALRRAYEKKVRVVYEIAPEQPIEFDRLVLRSEAVAFLKQGAHAIQHECAEDLRSALKAFVTSDGSLWPLVREARISGPFSELAPGLKLVDLPGVNDPNPAREAITKQYLDETPFVVVVFNSKRPIAKDVQEFIRDNDLLLRLFMEGKLPALTLVGTHAEQLPDNGQEIEDLGLDPESATDSELLQARNRRTVETCRRTLQELALDVAGEGPDQADGRLGEILKNVQVIPVASKSFQQLYPKFRIRKALVALTAEETNIPALRAHLNHLAEGRDIAAHAKAIERKLHLTIREVEDFFRCTQDQLAASTGTLVTQRQKLAVACEPPLQGLAAHLGEIEKEVAIKFDSHRAMFDDKLQIASRRAEHALTQVLSQWSMLHFKTLQAIAVNRGMFKSPSTGRQHSLGGDLAQPLLSSISFAWDDFFGHHLDTVLKVMEQQLQQAAGNLLYEIKIEAYKSGLAEQGLLSSLDGALDTTKQSIHLQIELTGQGLRQHIDAVRGQLTRAILETAGLTMQPACAVAALEKGRGMKSRMLSILRQHAEAQAAALFGTIRNDLAEGVLELRGRILRASQDRSAYVKEQGQRVVGNLTSSGIEASQTKVQDVAHCVSVLAGLIAHPGRSAAA